MAGDLIRIGELVAHSIRLGVPDAYFRASDDKLTNPWKRPFFERIEGDLQRLDDHAWAEIKNEALHRLAAHRDGRGWQGLFDILNQARGYAYLADLGCTAIECIPRGKRSTPDLQAVLGNQRLLCEVKTINISDAEVDRRRSGGVGTTLAQVTPQLLTKIHRTAHAAAAQMARFDAAARPLVYIVVNFDDLFHEYAPEYEAQIKAELAAHPPAVEVALDVKPRLRTH